MTLDRTAPTIAVDEWDVALVVPLLADLTVTGLASDATSPIRSVIVSLSQGGRTLASVFASRSGYEPSTSWRARFPDQLLLPGSYTLVARSIDEAGNSSPPFARDVVVI